MREVPPPSHRRSLPAVLGLMTVSVLCLCGGGLLAVSREGLPRLLFGSGGFAGYVFFFARALKILGLSSTISGQDGNRILIAAAILAPLTFASMDHRAFAQETAPQAAALAAPGVQFHGFVDVYAAWNPNQPSVRDNFEPGTGTTALKANQFGLNLAALEVSLDANPIGFHVSGVVGTGTDVVHAGEIHPSTWRNVSQASVSYKLDAGRGVLFELGIQPSHIGYEVFFSKDNWNYSRGWMGEFSPYYQTGLKVATTFDDHWSGQLWLINGWQNIEDNNDGKAIGTQVAYATDTLGVTWNLFAGPELRDDDSHWRTFSDFIATLKISSYVQLAASLDLGEQRRPGPSPARWQGASLWLRTLLSSSSSSSPLCSSALALRVEYFHDPDAAVSPLSQSLFGATITFEMRPHPKLIVKLEGRYDRSTGEAFGGPDGPLTRRDAFLLALGAVATF